MSHSPQVFEGKYWTITRYISGFANNAFLIRCNRTGGSVIIDTPADPAELITAASNTSVEKILITHGHRDHVEGYEAVSTNFRTDTGIGEGDRGSLPKSSIVNVNAATGAEIVVGDIVLASLHTPGHTPGSTCYLLKSPEPTEPSHLFSGDTLFPGGPGRSSSHDALKQILSSLETQIFVLADETAVLPGHGEFTTIGEAKREYKRFSRVPLDPGLYGDVTWSRVQP